MDAVEINENTIDMIEEFVQNTNDKVRSVRMFVNRRKTYYYIRGYYIRPPYGSWPQSNILPDHLFHKEFDYDPEVIKTNWTTIVYT